MPSVTYMNQSAPFWDFVASLEQQSRGAGERENHPWFSQDNDNTNRAAAEGDSAEEHAHLPPPPPPPPAFGFGPWGGWGNGFGGGRGFPFRGPPPYEGEGERENKNDSKKGDGEKDKDNENVGDKEKNKQDNNGEGPSGSGSGSDGEGNGQRRCGRRGGRCGGEGRRGRHGWGGPGHHGPGPRGWGPPPPFGPGPHHHGPPHHGPPHHGPPHHGRHGHGGPRGGGEGFNPWAFAANWLNPENFKDFTSKDTPAAESTDFSPEADIFDTPTTFVVHISLPGAKKEDVGVNWDAEKSELAVAGVVYRPGDEDFLKTLAMDERKVGPFERKIRLGTRATPAQIDAEGISAKLEDGILRIEVPKKLDDGFVEVRKVDIE